MAKKKDKPVPPATEPMEAESSLLVDPIDPSAPTGDLVPTSFEDFAKSLDEELKVPDPLPPEDFPVKIDEPIELVAISEPAPPVPSTAKPFVPATPALGDSARNALLFVRNNPLGVDGATIKLTTGIGMDTYDVLDQLVTLGLMRLESGPRANRYFCTPAGSMELGKLGL